MTSCLVGNTKESVVSSCDFNKTHKLVKVLVCLIKAIRVLQGRTKKGRVFMYYAEYCRYGINVSYASMNGNAYDFYAFPTKA